MKKRFYNLGTRRIFKKKLTCLPFIQAPMNKYFFVLMLYVQVNIILSFRDSFLSSSDDPILISG